MSLSIYIEAYAALLAQGIVSGSGIVPWKEDQKGPQDVMRDQVLNKPYPTYGKLSLPDKLAFAVSSLVITGHEPDDKDSSGIFCGLSYGSLSTDLRYMESVISGFPSPALFSGTLPSSAIADIAIFHGFKGENRVFCTGNGCGVSAFESAVSLLHRKKVSTALVVSVNALAEKDQTVSLTNGPDNKDVRAYAFLLSCAKTAAGTGMQLDTMFETSNKEMPFCHDELYFYDLISMLRENRSGTVQFNTEDLSGYFTIIKDE
jgi:hypothetical protein